MTRYELQVVVPSGGATETFFSNMNKSDWKPALEYRKNDFDTLQKSILDKGYAYVYPRALFQGQAAVNCTWGKPSLIQMRSA